MDDARTVVSADAPDAPREPARRRPLWVLLAYGAALVLIVLWPEPVDRGVAKYLQALTELVPWITHSRLERAANVLMFVPFGALIAWMWPALRAAIVPLALAATLTAETLQAVLLAQRTPDMTDVVANVIGAALGWALVVAVERSQGRHFKAAAV